MSEAITLTRKQLRIAAAAAKKQKRARQVIAADSRRAIRYSRKWRLDKFALVPATIALIGVIILSYPNLASWINQVNQSQLVEEYATVIDNAEPSKEKQLELAKKYNESLTSSATYTQGENKASSDAAPEDESLEYEKMLSTPESAVMARIKVPTADVDLPIYHGTSDEVLNVGVGHLKGTSLPVGGANTRSVLTAHRGLAESTLFTHLDRVKEGDEIVIEVFGETLLYRVSDIKTISPEETEHIRVEEGKDLVTLVTCTPLGINTHRILVTGTRVIPTPEIITKEAGARSELPGFPWWAVAMLAGIFIIAFYVYWMGTPRYRSRVLAKANKPKTPKQQQKAAAKEARQAAKAEAKVNKRKVLLLKSKTARAAKPKSAPVKAKLNTAAQTSSAAVTPAPKAEPVKTSKKDKKLTKKLQAQKQKQALAAVKAVQKQKAAQVKADKKAAKQAQKTKTTVKNSSLWAKLFAKRAAKATEKAHSQTSKTTAAATAAATVSAIAQATVSEADAVTTAAAGATNSMSRKEMRRLREARLAAAAAKTTAPQAKAAASHLAQGEQLVIPQPPARTYSTLSRKEIRKRKEAGAQAAPVVQTQKTQQTSQVTVKAAVPTAKSARAHVSRHAVTLIPAAPLPSSASYMGLSRKELRQMAATGEAYYGIRRTGK